MTKILFYLLLFSFIPGVLVSISAYKGINIYFMDLAIVFIALYWILNLHKLLHFLTSDKIAGIYSVFIISGIISLIFSPINMTFPERLISFLYVIRLTAYFLIYPAVVQLLKDKKLSINNILNSLSLIGLTLAFLGWIQYFLYPDLRNLLYLGWDPHDKRIFSTILDPNYFGLLLTLTAIIIFLNEKNHFSKSIKLIYTFITLLFTYSRSSFLSFFSSFTYYFVTQKKLLPFIAVFIFFITGILLLPRPYGESVRLERIFSIEERLTSMKQGITIFLDHPILGTGFNTLRYAKKQYGFLGDNWESNHAGSGVENSFIFILATTGLAGLGIFGFLIFSLFKSGNLFFKTSFLAILFHSLFLNSLFFPIILVWFWILSAIRDYK